MLNLDMSVITLTRFQISSIIKRSEIDLSQSMHETIITNIEVRSIHPTDSFKRVFGEAALKSKDRSRSGGTQQS